MNRCKVNIEFPHEMIFHTIAKYRCYEPFTLFYDGETYFGQWYLKINIQDTLRSLDKYLHDDAI